MACLCDNLQWIWARITKFAPNMHLGILSAGTVLNMEVIDLDLQGHLVIISTYETAFNIALVYWSRPAKGCYTSQTCSCDSWRPDNFLFYFIYYDFTCPETNLTGLALPNFWSTGVTISIRTLHDCPSQMNESLLISNSKLTSDSELIWRR